MEVTSFNGDIHIQSFVFSLKMCDLNILNKSFKHSKNLIDLLDRKLQVDVLDIRIQIFFFQI